MVYGLSGVGRGSSGDFAWGVVECGGVLDAEEDIFLLGCDDFFSIVLSEK